MEQRFFRWFEVICSDLILLFLPLVGPLSSWWGVGVFLLLNKPHYLLKIAVGDSWAEFSASEFSESHVGMGEIVESVASSDGPVFVANVDWAPASSLFEQQVVGVPAGWWVLCFMDVEVEPVRAVFSPDRFGELLRMLVGMSDKGL